MAVVLAVQPVLGALDITETWLLFGLVDWVGHLATGVVLIALLRPSRRVAVAILAGSVLLDLDHIPAELGSDVLTAGAPRPYTHTLLVVAVVLVAAGLARSRLLLGAAIGLAGHLGRDLATADVLVLWPLTDAVARVPFAVYVLVLALMAAGAVTRP